MSRASWIAVRARMSRDIVVWTVWVDVFAPLAKKNNACVHITHTYIDIHMFTHAFQKQLEGLQKIVKRFRRIFENRFKRFQKSSKDFC